ncbi:MAG: oligosaccharide flippase family protein [Firmicutes bacterium]|nr:oligosaccharide flippase family protein [Bacillota bacterium]
MNRAKKIFKDILLFALASFGPKMISFFLIPLYTSYLSTTDYGTMELLNTIYSLLLPILTLDISDAIMIYTIECKNTEREDLPMYIGKRIVGVSSVILIGILAILVIFWRLKNIKIYCLYIFAQYFSNAVYNNYLAFFKGRNKVNCIVIGSIISSVVTIISNIAFVFVFKWGLYGLLFATVLASSFSVTYFFLVRKTDNKKIGTIEDSREFKKKMLCYSIPLIFTGIAWWINSSSDRLFISVLANVSLNGIYAVANKIPAIITACHNVIFQALQLSVFNEIKSNDADVYLKKLYHIYSMVMVTVCSILILMDKTIATLLFKKDFFIAWHYAPALLISTVFFQYQVI